MSTNNKKTSAVIIGAGPVGSLLSIYLSKRNIQVEVFEKREDLRKSHKAEGRSINIALSHRGLKALGEIGLSDKIKEMAVPMRGRMIHDHLGNLSFQPYGESGQFINSISRNGLNEIIIEKAEKDFGVKFNFHSHCDDVLPEESKVKISSGEKSKNLSFDLLFGADGAFSNVRNSFKKNQEFSYAQEFLSHGYKELHIPPAKDGSHIMEKNALHIWPREQFMLIALPNLDGSFTATLFLPFKGEDSFEKIKTNEDIQIFFSKYFPDAIALMPDLQEEYFMLPPSYLVTVHCYPWISNKNICLIGDAAHAITPFYGQGMNAGFEDCRLLNEIITPTPGDWDVIFEKYQSLRKVNGDAIAELALQNFVEMRDLVGDEKFRLRKKIEAKIHEKFPGYLPLYSMVTFSDMPYSEALQKGKEHDQLMDEILKIDGIEKIWTSDEGWKKIEEIFKQHAK